MQRGRQGEPDQAGVGLVAAVGGGGSSFAGDALVLASLVLSAAFTVAQARLLPGRDPVAVTALQFLAAALAALPVAAAFGDPVGLAQAAGGAAILSGIALSSLPLLRPMHPGRVKTAPPLLQHAAGGGRGGREDGDGTTGHGAGFGQLAGPGTAAGEAAQPGGGVAGGARWVNRTRPPAPG